MSFDWSKIAPIARCRTKKEAQQKAQRYIKPGHRVIRKSKGTYQGKRYNYIVCVK
jgi:hypothetical protein